MSYNNLPSPNTADSSTPILEALTSLARKIEGDLRLQQIDRLLYAQDASLYCELPLGVVLPKSTKDVVEIVKTASHLNLPLIPRAAGTSLAGQCVGTGLVIDTGRYMNKMINLDTVNGVVEVEPGVILDDLNTYLAPHGWIFGPDTSTSNRCMIGGMVGNNSCGAHSIYYGTTRTKLLGMQVVLADGSVEWIEDWDETQLNEKLHQNNILSNSLKTLLEIIDTYPQLITDNYPRKDLLRRNSGYALDDLLFRRQAKGPFSLHRLLCGSEGTLAVSTSLRLKLDPLPEANLLVCAHFESLNQALEATVDAVKHQPAAVELIDDIILAQTKENLEQASNRFFIKGDPAALLVIEFYGSKEAIKERAQRLIKEFENQNLGYAYTLVEPPDDRRVWSLRKAGLGLLMGARGERKAVTCVEDTAVPVDQLPHYIQDFQRLMADLGTRSIYYAHASVGELHLRPELNLKDPQDVEKMKIIALESMRLVKKYRGSLSGEHGDGRVRGPFLKEFLGEEVYSLLVRVKTAFDPQNILNPHKIVNALPIDSNLRFQPDHNIPPINTFFDFSKEGGLLRAVEKCNGAGACRKKVVSGGTMCPSYRATLEERDSTRGRSNIFRLLLLQPNSELAFSSQEMMQALDLCLSCKACKRECPANVDMARLKSEYMQHYYDRHGIPLSVKLFGNYASLSKFASYTPRLSNTLLKTPLSQGLMRRLMRVTAKRQLPTYAPMSFSKWWRRRQKVHVKSKLLACKSLNSLKNDSRSLWLYVDPFTNYTEPEIAIAAVKLLEGLQVSVDILPIEEDGRTQLSKGLVRQAKDLANQNLKRVSHLLRRHPQRPVVGIEPSALLTFVDEYPDLCDPEWRETAAILAKATLLEDWLWQEQQKGSFLEGWSGCGKVVLHGHCHQKSLVGLQGTIQTLTQAGYQVQDLGTGCCGMAGSFGYEEDHYDLSMQVGEQVLFPALRKTSLEVLVAAAGTSCRHQIAHGVSRQAFHPIVLLERALKRTLK